MIDELLKRWRASGSVEDERNYLIAGLNAGRISRHRVEMAAALGNQASLLMVEQVAPLPDHHRSKVLAGVALLPTREAIQFALECAERAYSSWVAERPNDSRPLLALEAVRRWLLGEISTEADVARAALDAAHAAIEADDPDQVPDRNPSLTAAINAADSASHAALAVQNVLHIDNSNEPVHFGGVPSCVSYAARFAVPAAPNPKAEEQWQIERLIEYLLDRC